MFVNSSMCAPMRMHVPMRAPVRGVVGVQSSGGGGLCKVDVPETVAWVSVAMK
jgi:hypothetical protein